MKTAEETLQDYKNWYGIKLDKFTQQNIIAALNVHAAQFKPKKLIVADVHDLLNQYSREEISFSRMVELLNEKTGAI